MWTKASIVTVCAILLAVTACHDRSLGPNEPEITFAKHSFEFQGTGFSNFTKSLEYKWTNAGTTANINQTSAIDSGSAVLTILDADSVQVYSRPLADNGTFVTSSGRAGIWVIRVTSTDLSGKLSFRVQETI